MARAFAAPGKYIQRAGEIGRLAAHLAPLGSSVLVVIDRFVADTLGPLVAADLAAAGIRNDHIVFGGECTLAEVARTTAAARDCAADVLVGVGGGKTADTVKIAAHEAGARAVIVPTIASTDAPCSAVAVRYDDLGVYEGTARLPRNPDLVVVDTAVVASAPPRFLMAGVGDALSTWIEARANLETAKPNYVAGGFPPTLTAIALVRACHESLMTDAVAAKEAVESGLITPAVENIVETTVLLSSVGFENLGCSAAHSIHDGLLAVPQTHTMLHGELVAFGALCELVLERRDDAEIDGLLTLCDRLGLPTTLGALGITGTPAEVAAAVEVVATVALAPGESIHGSPAELSVQAVADAILALDVRARSATGLRG